MPRPDVPAKVTGRHLYVQNLTLPGMLHGRVIRPPALGATLQSVDESSIAAIPGARVVRIGSFLGVVAEREWDAVRAARALRAQWSSGTGLPDHAYARRRGPRDPGRARPGRGEAGRPVTRSGRPGPGVQTLGATYWWPVQTHGSLGPSCGVADVRPDGATIWTPSQATHRFREAFARILGLPREKVRLIYLDGAGSYGQNGAEDAACDAALLSRAVGRPVRVQWMREDEHGWDPKGPPQLLDLRAAVGEGGEVVAWETQAWLPVATQGLPSIPLLAPIEAGINQPLGRSSGPDPAEHRPAVPRGRGARRRPLDRGLARSGRRPIRTPGKIANTFAVESFVDEVCALAKVDPIEYRMRRLADPRAQEVLRRAAARMGWQPRPSPRPPDPGAAVLTGRGIAYVHYKHAENHVAIGMEVAVERATGVIRVTRVVCAQDCGLMINPDNVASQLEGNILQTLSRTLHEEIVFDRRPGDQPRLGRLPDPPLRRGADDRARDDPAPRRAAARRRRGRLGAGAGGARQRRLRRHGRQAARRALPSGSRQGGAGGGAT